jgi:hypothetical protein
MKAKGERRKAKEEGAVPALTSAFLLPPSAFRLAAMTFAITDSGD